MERPISRRSNQVAAFLAALVLTLPQICDAELQVVPHGSEHENILRLPIGVSFYNSGWYSCNYFYPYYACASGSYGNYTPFTLGLQGDIHIGGSSYITPGLTAMTGDVSTSYYNGLNNVNVSNHVTLWAPSVDYVAKWGDINAETVGRLRFGGVFYAGSDGNTGGGFRVGGGGSLFNQKRIGIGLDVVFEGGSYHGYWISGIQLLASPEFHF